MGTFVDALVIKVGKRGKKEHQEGGTNGRKADTGGAQDEKTGEVVSESGGVGKV